MVWVERGDLPRLGAISSIAFTSTSKLTAEIIVLNDKGELKKSSFDAQPVGSQTAEDFDAPTGGAIKHTGTVVEARVKSNRSGKRGQTYVALEVPNRGLLARGYVYESHQVTLGENVESTEGRGFLSWVALATNIAGNVATNATLAATNTLRKIYGFVAYYNCDATVATRTIRPEVDKPGNAVPTGFTSTPLVWRPGAAMSLTASQEGTVYAMSTDGKDGISVQNANGTETFDSSASRATPFPFWIPEDDNAILSLTPGAGVAGDVYSILALIEEWLMA